MKAAVLEHPLTISIKSLERPVPNAGEVLIKITAVGLCGSDVHYYEHGKIGRFVVEKPIILGHEAAGEIVGIGEGVTSLSVGQRVAIEPGMTCGECEFCRDGTYNLCSEVEFLATPPYDGAFCEYVTMREEVVYPIPDSMSDETAALIEPFSVGLHAVRRGTLTEGETVIIMGMGPIGLMAAANARLAGASMIVAVDLEEKRLDMARQFGATHTVNLREGKLEEELAHITDGRGVDLALETAGHPDALRQAIQAVRRGGRVVIVGLPPVDEVSLPVPYMVDSELKLIGVFRYHHTYPDAIKLLSDGKVDITQMITGKYSLEETGAAFQAAIHDKANTLKMMIYPG
ncbi:NAD(P)-dependent alcohol dehydrogenase [Aureibacillus halotolerans]|uniref:L-iditol 2-dehydrogenase n=1 Tax=Aureibacillus halotolerans TaxID=1508390 RepID=A0A4R6U5N7_9BACI|nr:NAD(P)-dependent alcohol dehydrogenase [Aureibacillus halotolerans]TDQ41066.1 L-iditol 2-dehydrogenase [Aureibacillus halotolerans]